MDRRKRIELSIRSILEAIGEDPNRKGLEKTPYRVAKMYLDEVLKGYSMDVDSIINEAIFEENYDEMVVVKDIDFYSMCEHHMIPFFGVVHVGYIPDGKVIGLSKIPRIVEVFSRRLQLQERLTYQIAQTLYNKLKPLGVAVVVEGIHLCTVMRGVEKPRNKMITSTMLGVFREDIRTRNEFLRHIGRRFELID